jgi:hypothetical protein
LQRLEYEKAKGADLGELSENVIYDTLKKAISILELRNIAILCHYPLSRLIVDGRDISDEQKRFVNSPLSHVDFLLYNTITKRPLLCIEVDGWQFHHTEVQKYRDAIKDEILDKYGLKPMRLSTTSVVTIDTIKNILIETLKSKA